MGNPAIRCFALINSRAVVRHRRIENMAPGQGRLCGGRWLWYVALIALLVSNGLLIGSIGAAERPRPFRIGALTESWGPTPPVIGLRGGLLELGYREDEQSVIGHRFTQGNLTALPTAARELVQHTDPAEIPVEVNPKIEFAMNLKVAKALALAIGPEVLYQADRLVR
jgi:hypothetical protein